MVFLIGVFDVFGIIGVFILFFNCYYNKMDKKIIIGEVSNVFLNFGDVIFNIIYNLFDFSNF